VESIGLLARKIPHYRRYSYLVFEGESMQNVAKGQWPVLDSPLMHQFDSTATNLPLVPRSALQP